jgi:hypothetical protein
MKNQPLAIVFIAQTAINLIAVYLASNTKNTDIIHCVQPFGVRSAIKTRGSDIQGRFRESGNRTATRVMLKAIKKKGLRVIRL